MDRTFKRMNKSQWILLSALLLIGKACFAAEVHIGFSSNKPPYTLQGGGGLSVEIVKAALAYKGHDLKAAYFDTKHLSDALKQQRVTAIASVHSSIDDGKLFYSQPYIAFHNYAISRQSTQCLIPDIAALKKYSVVAWQFAHKHLGESFKQYFQETKPLLDERYIENRDQLAQNRMFWQGKAEVILADKLLFNWNRAVLSNTLDTQEPVVFHDIFERPNQFKLGFRSKPIRDDFDAGLQHLRDSGGYQEIYNRFTVPQKVLSTRAMP